jgi:predicted CoA-binding protein
MNFHALFEPKTMAVIGVSLTNDRNPANVVFTKNHLRYPVRVFPVNLRGGELRGEKIYTSLAEIPERIDLAIIAVKAEQARSRQPW